MVYIVPYVNRVVETYTSCEKLPLWSSMLPDPCAGSGTQVINRGKGGEFIIVMYLFFFNLHIILIAR